MVVKTFRGLLADGGQDQIRLSTNKGKTGYRVVKFQTLPNTPGTVNVEAVLKIYKQQQTSINGTVDFSDGRLLAACNFTQQGNPQYTGFTAVIFDGEIVNQDIYITSVDVDSATAMNYYIELEVISLTDQGAEYTTLKDIRSELTIS